MFLVEIAGSGLSGSMALQADVLDFLGDSFNYANSLVVWACGASGVTATLGVDIAPALTPAWLYPRLVWGGLWGVLFVLLGQSRMTHVKGLLASLAPSAVQLLIVFPFAANKGWLGLGLGGLAPLLVLGFNAVWGLTAAEWIRRNTV